MPDVHPGKVGTIGLTMTVNDKIMPNLVGIDIGCGMSTSLIKDKNIEFKKLYKVIRENIPSGFCIRKSVHHLAEEFDLSKLHCHKLNRKDALNKLNIILCDWENDAKQSQIKSAWKEHNLIVRGNPVRVYKGVEFRRTQ